MVRVADVTKDQYGNEPFDYDSTDSARYDDARYDEPLDAEIVDEPVEYRGAHRRDDDADYDEGSDYVDGNYINAPAEETERRGSTAVAAGAGSGAAAGGLPRRGLAMILIAVAALLLLWALWAMTQKGGDDNAASSETSTSTEVVAPSASPAPADGQQQGEQGAAGQSAQAGASDQAQNPNASQDPNAPASETVPRDPNAQDGNAQDGNAQAPAPAAPAPQGAQLNSGNAEVFVYNNSGVADLASRTADQLQGQFRVANQSPDAATMNMPEQQYGVFPETYVFFDPATPGAEQVAADIARRVGGTARAKNDIPEGAVSLPEQVANNRSAVAVVLAG